MPSRTAFLTNGYEGFERSAALETAAARDAELLDAMVAHIRTPLRDSVVDGYAPKAPSNNLLARHLEFFDRDRDGTITSSESYKGWRAVGLSPLKSAVQTVGAAVVFNGGLSAIRPAHLGALIRAVCCAVFSDSMPAMAALDLSVQAALENRPKNPSGVLNSAGHVDEARFRQFIQAFLDYSRGVRDQGQPADCMTPKQFLGFLKTEAVKGLGKRQFETMLTVLGQCGGDYVRPIHLAAIYSGAFLYNAQAVLAGRPR